MECLYCDFCQCIQLFFLYFVADMGHACSWWMDWNTFLYIYMYSCMPSVFCGRFAVFYVFKNLFHVAHILKDSAGGSASSVFTSFFMHGRFGVWIVRINIVCSVWHVLSRTPFFILCLWCPYPIDALFSGTTCLLLSSLGLICWLYQPWTTSVCLFLGTGRSSVFLFWGCRPATSLPSTTFLGRHCQPDHLGLYHRLWLMDSGTLPSSW